jgi:ABC-2 type transport system permease protein
MGLDFGTVYAIFARDMRKYLGNPTGYVFLTLFIATTAAAAFLQDGFFARNLADLAELNSAMPAILMFFVPALTMSAWADERRAGTDELLLTLPVRDSEVVLGKYLGVLGMYTVSLAFSLLNVGMLVYLGDPDVGLMFSTYLGYWLMGALFCAIGLVASMLTPNPTVAFILGALGCAGLVFASFAPAIVGGVLIGLVAALVVFVLTTRAGWAGIGGVIVGAFAALVLIVSDARGEEEAAPATEATQEAKADPEAAPTATDDDSLVEAFDSLSVTDHLVSFGEGVIRIGDVVYFGAGVVAMLYLAGLLLGRRHW